MKEPEDEGKRGKKPGPKPKHKRKNAKMGSLTAPTIAMTQQCSLAKAEYSCKFLRLANMPIVAANRVA